MSWCVIAYETARGEKPIEGFIRSLTEKTIAKVSREIDLLERHGSRLGMPHAKKVSVEIYELRIRGKEAVRIFYGFRGENIYLLHGIKKKTQKLPSRDIKLALERYRSLI